MNDKWHSHRVYWRSCGSVFFRVLITILTKMLNSVQRMYEKACNFLFAMKLDLFTFKKAKSNTCNPSQSTYATLANALHQSYQIIFKFFWMSPPAKSWTAPLFNKKWKLKTQISSTTDLIDFHLHVNTQHNALENWYADLYEK